MGDYPGILCAHKARFYGVRGPLRVFLAVHVISRAFLKDEFMLSRPEDVPAFGRCVRKILSLNSDSWVLCIEEVLVDSTPTSQVMPRAQIFVRLEDFAICSSSEPH